MFKIIFFLSLFFSGFVFGQDTDAILYFNDGTRLEGFGEIEDNKVLFRLTKNDKADTWTHDDVKGITLLGFEMKIALEYVKLKKYSSPELLEIVTRGNVNLYKFTASSFQTFMQNATSNNNSMRQTFVTNSEWYYLKRDSEEFPTEVKPVFFKKITRNYFGDCETLIQKINANEYSMETIDKLVEYYDDICSD